ncbi:hypothetical protein KW785_02480 [Candidatus Parcubacteria bacterium]|nr:hypothetical protein [Candidatus Parcubacteria bacterium]
MKNNTTMIVLIVLIVLATFWWFSKGRMGNSSYVAPIEVQTGTQIKGSTGPDYTPNP